MEFDVGEVSRVRSLDEVVREHILHVVRLCGNHKTRASQLLGIDRSTLWKKLRDYGVEEIEPASIE